MLEGQGWSTGSGVGDVRCTSQRARERSVRRTSPATVIPFLSGLLKTKMAPDQKVLDL